MFAKSTRISGHCGMDLSCTLTTTSIDDVLLMRYTTHGIRVMDPEGEVVFEMPDISTDKGFVERFVSLCCEKQVAQVHLADVLDDYLA